MCIRDSNDSLQFQRGSVLNNTITFNPLKWKSNIDIRFEGDLVRASFDINTIYQAVTFEEENMWDKFISNFQKSIETGESFISENNSALKATKQSAWKYIKYAILGALIFVVPSGVIAHYTGVTSITTVGAVIGSVIFLINKINQDKEDNAV